jgi:hypothetical protein
MPPPQRGVHIPARGATPGMRPDPFAASCRDAAWRRVSGGDALVCGVPSERTGVAWRISKALPWAGMRRPHGAEGTTCCRAMRRVNLAKMCQTIFLPDQEFWGEDGDFPSAVDGPSFRFSFTGNRIVVSPNPWCCRRSCSSLPALPSRDLQPPGEREPTPGH